MLKKILIVAGIIIFLLISTIIVLPFIFKDKIIQKVKEEANKNLSAKIDFGEFDLSLLSSFPNFTFIVHDVKVDGLNEFKGITLASIGKFEFIIDIKSVLSGGQININKFKLADADFHAVVMKNGKANWDITKPDTATEPPNPETSGGSGEFKMSLKEYSLENSNIIYDDSSFNMYCQINNLNHHGSGDFTQDVFNLNTLTTADRLTFIYDGIPYFSKVKTTLKMDLEMDMPKFKFTFKENEFQLNQLVLGLNGWVAMPADDVDMDIQFSAKQTEFKNILSLVPAIYSKDFETVKTAGKLALDGFAKGKYNDKTIPGFGLNLSVDDARFQYTDLPKSAENITIKVKVNNPGGDADKTVVDIQKFHVEMAKNPVDIRMKISTPVSDANIDGEIKAQINLDNLKDVIPMTEGENYTGSLTSDISVKGRLSSIEKEKYEEFKANGTLILLGIKYQSKEFPYGVNIEKAYFNFSPKFIELSSFESKIGKSDLGAMGKIENFLAYYFKNEPLKGTFSIHSNLLDLNEFMSEDSSAVKTEGSPGQTPDTAALSVIEVPSNLDFKLSSSIKKLIYENLEMTDVAGDLTLKDSEINLEKFKLATLKGTLEINGKYGTKNPKIPAVDFNLNIEKFDLPLTFKTFNTVQKLAPIAEHATGKFSAKMKFACLLNQKMEPVMNSIYGSGSLLTHQISVESSGALAKLAASLKKDSYKKLYLDNVDVGFKIKDGKVEVEPFDMKIQNTNANISGWSSFDQTIKYVMKLDVPSSEFGGMANSALNALSAFTGTAAPKTIKANVIIEGTISDPKVKVDFSDMADGITSSVKDMAKDELEKQKAELEKKALEEAGKLKDQAQQEAEKVKKEAEEKAKAEAEKIKKEAEEKINAETEKAKKDAENKVKDAAKDQMKNLFKKPK